MAINGELSGLSGVTCSCPRVLKLQVCQSAAGYYLGYICPRCGPWSRETGYYTSREEAETELAEVTPALIRTIS